MLDRLKRLLWSHPDTERVRELEEQLTKLRVQIARQGMELGRMLLYIKQLGGEYTPKYTEFGDD